MKKIKYLILTTLLIGLIFAIFDYKSGEYKYPNENNFAIQGLDDSRNKENIFKDINNYLTKNKLEMFTVNGSMNENKIIYKYYSTFTSKEYYQKKYNISSDEIPKEKNFLATNSTNNELQVGHLNLYTGKNEMELSNISALEHTSLDRIYYFPDSTTQNIEDIQQILNKYNLLTTYTEKNNSYNFNPYILFLSIYLILLMIFLVVVEQILESKEIAIKAFNGYSEADIIKNKIKEYGTIAGILNIILFSIIVIALVLITTDYKFITGILLTYIKLSLLVNLIIVLALTFILYLSISFIDVTKIKNNVSSKFILFISYFSKLILFLIIFLIAGTLSNSIKETINTKDQLEGWKKLENYYSASYYNDISSSEDNIDFNTMKLDYIDQKNKDFIDSTQNEYNGIIIDSHAYGAGHEYNKEMCLEQYDLDCNTVVINQNYLDLINIKNEKNQSINIDSNSKIDILIPYEQKKDEEKIKKNIINNLNDISPSFQYNEDDFNTTIVKKGTCYPTYNLSNENPCLNTVALEMGEYYYNYNLLLTTGYFIELENQSDPYSDIEKTLKENDLEYNFPVYTNKTSEIYEYYNSLKAKIIKNVILLITSFIMIIIISYYTIKVYIGVQRKRIVINLINGRSIYETNKVLFFLNMFIYAIVLLIAVNFLNIFIIIFFLVIDSLIIHRTLKKILKKEINSYVKGYND